MGDICSIKAEGEAMTTIASKMKNRRTQLNLKVRDVASQVGVAESTYRDWENGRKIQGEPYIKIARALNMSVLELLRIESPNTSDILLSLVEIEKHIKFLRRHVI
jgi:transcriptional regulator with XRE-family HTH domain